MLSEIKESSLLEVLRNRCEQTPDKVAFTYLRNGEVTDGTLSFAQLHLAASAVAAWLQGMDLVDKPVLLLYPPGLDFIVGFYACLYSGAIAVPVVPPRNNRNLSNFDCILGDANAAAILTNAEMGVKLEKLFVGNRQFENSPMVKTDTVPMHLSDAYTMRSAEHHHVAFMQYTSGSTSAPKGVVVSHGNLLHNHEMMKRYFGHTDRERFATWLPHYHDMGLIGNLLQTVYVGGHCHIMAPSAFVKKPLTWLKIMSDRGATYSGSPNFGYQLCVDRISEEQCAGLDLSGWRNAFCGAEPIRANTMEAFIKKFEPYGFMREAMYPCYGMAEATLMISGGKTGKVPVIAHFDKAKLEADCAVPAARDSQGVHAMVSCGKPACGQTVAIVDSETAQQLTAGQVGEIWVSGESVCGGYFNKPGISQQVFAARLAEDDGRTYVRSGDLGFVDDNGELFVSGRLKDLIIVCGKNQHPQDIELAVANCHEALALDGGATFSVDMDGEEQVVVAHEVLRRSYRSFDFDDIVATVKATLSEMFDIDLASFVLLKPGRVARTSSGKIKRSANKHAFLNDALEFIDRWDKPFATVVAPAGAADTQAPPGNTDFQDEESVQQWLARKIAGYLSLDSKTMELSQPVAEYGMNSSIAMQLVGDITESIDRDIEPTFIWEYPTINALSAKIVSMA